jgi:hypothetical protein
VSPKTRSGRSASGWLVDQVLGPWAVLLRGRRHLDGRDQRLGRVGRRGVQLVAIEALVLRLAPMAHLGVDRRDDPALASAAAKPGDAVLVDLEVLANKLAQERVGVPDGVF